SFEYEDMNREYIEYIEFNNIKYTLLASLKYKQNIKSMSYTPIYIIWDPINTSKSFGMLKEIDKSRLNNYQEVIEKVKKVENSDKFDLTILIAEDNPINQKLIKITLEQMGIKTVLANNGLEAFNKYSIAPEKYDLILMDIQMPVMDGIEATHEILDFEKDEEIPHTPIIALTANALKGDRERFLAEGMDEYLTKPINKDALINILKKFASQKVNAEAPEVIEENKIIKNSNEEEKENSPKSETESLTLDLFESDKNIIVGIKDEFNKALLKEYLKEFGFENVQELNKINDIIKAIDKNSKNILILDNELALSRANEIAHKLKQQIDNISVIGYKVEGDAIDYTINEIVKNELEKILHKG
ncbi:MAG: hypothetical protein DSY40_02345, partial [Nautilia sp.]